MTRQLGSLANRWPKTKALTVLLLRREPGRSVHGGGEPRSVLRGALDRKIAVRPSLISKGSHRDATMHLNRSTPLLRKTMDAMGFLTPDRTTYAGPATRLWGSTKRTQDAVLNQSRKHREIQFEVDTYTPGLKCHTLTAWLAPVRAARADGRAPEGRGTEGQTMPVGWAAAHQ